MPWGGGLVDEDNTISQTSWYFCDDKIVYQYLFM